MSLKSVSRYLLYIRYAVLLQLCQAQNVHCPLLPLRVTAAAVGLYCAGAQEHLVTARLPQCWTLLNTDHQDCMPQGARTRQLVRCTQGGEHREPGSSSRQYDRH